MTDLHMYSHPTHPWPTSFIEQHPLPSLVAVHNEIEDYLDALPFEDHRTERLGRTADRIFRHCVAHGAAVMRKGARTEAPQEQQDVGVQQPQQQQQPQTQQVIVQQQQHRVVIVPAPEAQVVYEQAPPAPPPQIVFLQGSAPRTVVRHQAPPPPRVVYVQSGRHGMPDVLYMGDEYDDER